MNRLTIVRGPAVVKYNSGVFFSKDDIELDWGEEIGDVQSSMFGKLFSFFKDLKPTLKLNLVGEWEHLAILFPYFATTAGTSIFGAADTTLEICPLDTTQQKITFKAAAVSKMPELNLSAEGPVLGSVEFRFLRGNGLASTDAAAWLTFATNDYDGTGMSLTDILVQSHSIRWLSAGTFTLTYGGDTTAALDWDATAQEVEDALNALASVTSGGGLDVTGSVDLGWTVTWRTVGTRTAMTGTASSMPTGLGVESAVVTAGAAGAAGVYLVSLEPWHLFTSQDGIKVSFDIETADMKDDALGTYDVLFKGMSVKASLVPNDVTAVELVAAACVQNTAAIRGRRMITNAHTLRVYATGLYVELYGAQLSKHSLVWSDEKQRCGPCEFTANRTISAGTVGALAYVGTAAP